MGKSVETKLKKKENVLADYMDIVEKSWTFEKLTGEEKQKLYDMFHEDSTRRALKGNYIQRWNVLNAVYGAFLNGVGYDGFNWRSESEDAPTF